MIEKFIWEKFKNININDVFFSSLKEDYPEFCEWYNKKHEEEALTYSDENGLHAFMYLKKETKSIILADKIMPAIDRLKIGTLKLDDSIKGQRLGEGFIGVACTPFVFPLRRALCSVYLYYTVPTPLNQQNQGSLTDNIL